MCGLGAGTENGCSRKGEAAPGSIAATSPAGRCLRHKDACDASRAVVQFAKFCKPTAAIRQRALSCVGFFSFARGVLALFAQ